MEKKACGVTALKEAGYRLTGPRKKVLDYLRQGEHYTAREIYNGLDKTLGLTTVYRTLELFLAIKLIRPLHFTGGSLKYEYLPDKKHHHHLICTECGSISEIEGCAILNLEKQIEKATLFEVTGHALELYGVCPNCGNNKS